jgi:antitoxin YefM
MDAISYSAFRADLAGTMDRVCDDREPIVVTRKNGRSVVMLSLEDYKLLKAIADTPQCYKTTTFRNDDT